MIFALNNYHATQNITKSLGCVEEHLEIYRIFLGFIEFLNLLNYVYLSGK